LGLVKASSLEENIINNPAMRLLYDVEFLANTIQYSAMPPNPKFNQRYDGDD
jgi:hypothetical protein